MKNSKTAKFVISAEKFSQCPEFNLKEFALLGRSNVGKSSFINAIANNKKLAKTSNTPGKTRLINFFNFSDTFIIADLPGYGFANVKNEMKDNWQKNLEYYLLNRTAIISTIQFIDARHEVQNNDLQMRDWLFTNNIPVITVANKIDYISRGKIQSTLYNFRKVLQCDVFPFSAKDSFYNAEIIKYLEEKE